MVILGGMGNVWGVILGGGFLAYLNEEGLGNIGGWLNEHFSGQSSSADKWTTLWAHDIDIPLYSSGIFGLILVLVMLFKPEGLIPTRGAKPSSVEASPTSRSTMFSMSDLLTATGVRKVFGGLVAVNDVDFTIPEKAIVSLIGPNGAGKTTFFNMLTGVYKPTGGRHLRRVRRDGQAAARDHGKGIGRTFQNIRLFQNMTALENTLVGMHSRL